MDGIMLLWAIRRIRGSFAIFFTISVILVMQYTRLSTASSAELSSLNILPVHSYMMNAQTGPLKNKCRSAIRPTSLDDNLSVWQIVINLFITSVCGYWHIILHWAICCIIWNFSVGSFWIIAKGCRATSACEYSPSLMRDSDSAEKCKIYMNLKARSGQGKVGLNYCGDRDKEMSRGRVLTKLLRSLTIKIIMGS